MHRRICFVFTSLAVMAIFSASTLGQVTGGAVTGTVVDATGALVPNATVTLQNKQTGQSQTTQTTGSGSYTYPNVAVGQYQIRIEASGFQPLRKELRVALNQTTTVDVTLQTGQLTEVVDITEASEALVQADNSQLGKSYETRLVQNLPIFGSQNQLALLAPNVVERSSGVLGEGGSVGGTRPRGNVFIVDGVDNNDPSVTGPAVGVIQDAIQEFTLLQNNFGAEFGGGAGGQFVTITKSGTNEFHASAFAYLQHQKLNAASTQEERQLQSGEILELPRFRNSRIGLTFGGPIIKNKLFFFGAFERTQNETAGSSGETFLAPTDGGLAQLAGLPGVSPFIINLLRNNLTLAPVATETQTVLGVPNIPFGEVTLNVPAGFLDKSYQINIDYNRTVDQFRFRFGRTDFSQEEVGLGSPTFNNLVNLPSRVFSTTWVRTFSPSLVNDLRLSYRRFIQDFPLKDPANLSFPNIAVRPLSLELGPQGNLPQSGADNVYQVYDTLSIIRGAHTFKIGAEFRRLLTGTNFLARQRGDYIYNRLDELLLDLPPDDRSNALRGVGNGAFTGNTSRLYIFGQDDWKVTPNLTLNLGLRYEWASVPRAIKDFLPFFSGVSVPGLNFEEVESDKNNFAPRVGFAYSPDFSGGWLGRLFGERGKSSIRANFAVSYNDVFQNLIIFSKPPQLEQELDLNQVLAAIPNFNLGPGFLQRGGLPAIQLPFEGGPEAVRATIGGITNTETFTMPYTMSWALSFQRQLTPAMAVELRYLGTRSRKLPVQVPLNLGQTPESALTLPTLFLQTNASTTDVTLPAGLTTTLADIRALPGVRTQPFADQGFFGGITAFPPVGNSQYDGASVSVTRRFSRGLAFTSAYTWSKTIDDSTNELFSSVVNPRRPEFFTNLRRERSLSALDIPHRFVFGANYEIPLFRNSTSEFLRNFVGGWEIAPVFQAQSGQPFTPLSGIDSNQNFDSAPDRTIINIGGASGTASRVAAVNAQGQFINSAGSIFNADGSRVTISQATVGSGGPLNAVAFIPINPGAQYIQAGPGALTTAGRNTLRSNGYNRTDVTIIKNFRFGEERYNVQVGAEIFNLLNQRIETIGGAPSGDVVNPNLERFGVGPTNTSFNNVTSSRFNDYSLGNFGGRIIQLRAKLIF